MHTEPSVPPLARTREQTRAFYNKISRVYDLLSDRSEGPVRREGLTLLNPRQGERILEIGFGTGHTLVAIANAVGPEGTVLGLDLSDEMVRITASALKASRFVDRAQLCRGDATHLPYEAASLDAVFMSFTLEVFEDSEIPAVLRECRRVLRQGGRLVVVGMSKGRRHDPAVEAFEWAHQHFPNFLDCHPIHVREAISVVGFTLTTALITRMWIPVEIVLAVNG